MTRLSLFRRGGLLALAVCAVAALGYATLLYGGGASSGAQARAAASDHEPPWIELPNACVADGALAGGQPSKAHLAQAAASGYRTVINMQPLDEAGVRELEAAAETLELKFLTLPIAGADDLTRANAERFAELLEQAEAEVMVTCASGNRVGAMFALKAYYIDGASAEEAEAIGLASGLTSLQPAVRQILGLD